MQTRQVNLEGTGEIQFRRPVKEALRMRPDRIIVGEVRQGECLDLLMVPLVYPPAQLLTGIVVNRLGQRFVAEDSYHARTSAFVLEQPGA